MGQAARRGERPADGYFCEYTRVLFQHPVIAAWEKFWVDSHSAMHREIYGLVKWINPDLQCGMHVWQVTNTYSLLLKAQYPYADMVRYADFLKPVVYHTPAGTRFSRFVQNLHQTILRDMTRAVHRLGYLAFSSPVDRAAMNASWGTSTRPTIFIRFLPSFCFSRSLRLRVMSPP